MLTGSTCCETNDDCPGCTECKDFHCKSLDSSKCCDGERLPAGYICCNGFAIPADWVCCDGTPAPPGSICCENDEDCPNCHQCKNFHCQQDKSYGEPDCCDPCEAARNNIAADVAGGVVCCNGKKYSCAWYHDVSNSKAAELIFYCIKKHEDEHHDSLTCPESGFLVFEFFDDGVDVNAEEIHAHNVEFDCLIDSLPHCEGDPECVADLLKTMGHVNDQIQDYGGSPRPLP